MLWHRNVNVYYYNCFICAFLAPLIEPQSTTIPVLVDSDVTSRTMTVHTPVVRDERGEIR